MQARRGPLLGMTQPDKAASQAGRQVGRPGRQFDSGPRDPRNTPARPPPNATAGCRWVGISTTYCQFASGRDTKLRPANEYTMTLTIHHLLAIAVTW